MGFNSQWTFLLISGPGGKREEPGVQRGEGRTRGEVYRKSERNEDHVAFVSVKHQNGRLAEGRKVISQPGGKKGCDTAAQGWRTCAGRKFEPSCLRGHSRRVSKSEKKKTRMRKRERLIGFTLMGLEINQRGSPRDTDNRARP